MLSPVLLHDVESAQILLPSIDGVLEVSLLNAVVSTQNITVICHPHPLYGGTMDNKVVTTLMRSFHALNHIVVRFNFRGVGRSSGEHDRGIGESDDLVTVLQALQQGFPQATLSLAGFSFGAYVAYRVATLTPYRDLLSFLLLVAPPVMYPEFATLPTPVMPWWIAQGEADEVVDPNAVWAFAAQCTPAPKLLRFANTSHFFHGELIQLKQRLIETFH